MQIIIDYVFGEGLFAGTDDFEVTLAALAGLAGAAIEDDTQGLDVIAQSLAQIWICASGDQFKFLSIS